MGTVQQRNQAPGTIAMLVHVGSCCFSPFPPSSPQPILPPKPASEKVVEVSTKGGEATEGTSQEGEH